MSEPPESPHDGLPATNRLYGGMSPEERIRQRRARLLSAGLNAFGTCGFADSTIRDVCRAAGMSERYFYESFPSKDELFAAVYEQATTDLIQRLMQTMAGAGYEPMGLVHACLRTLYEHLKAQPLAARVMLVEVFRSRQASLEVMSNYAGMVRLFIGALYPDMKRLGLDLEQMVQGLNGMSMTMATAWVVRGCDRSVDDMVHTNMVPYRALHDWYVQAVRNLDLGGAKPPNP